MGPDLQEGASSSNKGSQSGEIDIVYLIEESMSGSGVMQLLPSLGKGGHGKWPFLVMLLLSVVLLGASPRLYPRLATDDFRAFGGLDTNRTKELMYNPFGPDFETEKAKEIFSCITRGWPKPAPTEEASNNTALPGKECPSYFRFIHKDLAPWKQTGITKEMIERARKRAGFRVVIVGGKLYIQTVYKCWQGRAVQPVWGLLLLLEKYAGKVPDLEFVLNCEDRPRIVKWRNPAVGPPILFSFDSNSDHFDIPFPDWSFWGWPELQISSWDEKREAIVSNSAKTEWEQKVPMAYWTGNVYVGAPHRKELFKCHQARLTEIHHQNWNEELRIGKAHSKLEDQCTHRYMIYTEGNGWSVSLKYIFACGSPVLSLAPSMYDFFSRGLRQWVHYIPIRPPALVAPDICDAMDKGVEFGEANHTQAVQIGKAGQDFMRNELNMENVYSYTFHLLQEYASLLTFKPALGDAHLVTLDHVLCLTELEIERHTLQQARASMSTNPVPCQISESDLEDDWQTH